ncbi:MAG: SPOR domain-containing protein [Bacteroidales bacterium]
MRNLILALAAIVLLASGCEFFEKKKMFSKEDTLVAYQRRVDSLKRIDSLKKAKAIEKQKAEQARKDSIKKAEEERKRLYKFHVIVGSFKTKKYANAYNDFIAQKGYKTEVIRNQYQFDMISIGAYKSWREAVKDLEDAREAIEPTSWIYIDN